MNEPVSVVGLGKLGLCLAACFAYKGFRTIGVDVQESVVASVNAGISPLVEPLMAELIGALGGNMLCTTTEHAVAIEHSNITFVLTATPSQPDGSFSNHQVKAALTSLAHAFGNSKKQHHTFVISSTIVPGSIEDSFIPLLERESGKKLHEHFDVCFDPDFVALGSVVRDFLNPDLVIIGESRPGAGDRVEAIHRKICENSPHISRMSLVNAEIAKVSLNAYITLKISFANTLANICEKIPGADVDTVTNAIGRDKRISPYYFRGGLGFGGTCFPRDTKAFKSVSLRHGIIPELMNAVERVNEHQYMNIIEIVLREARTKQNPTVGILGLAFKANTPVITESTAIKLIDKLLQEGVRVVVFDPIAMEETRCLFHDKITYAPSAERCIREAAIVVLVNDLPEYIAALHRNINRSHTVIDCWRAFTASGANQSAKHIKIGSFGQ